MSGVAESSGTGEALDEGEQASKQEGGEGFFGACDCARCAGARKRKGDVRLDVLAGNYSVRRPSLSGGEISARLAGTAMDRQDRR